MGPFLILCALALLAGCTKPVESSPPPAAEAAAPAPTTTPTTVSGVVDAMTQRTAIEAGLKAKATIQRVSEQEKQDRKAAGAE